MIRYIRESSTGGKILEWEEMIRSNVSAAIVSGFAKSMTTAINNDLKKIYDMRKESQFERSEEKIYQCDVKSVLMSTSGDHMSICYSILLNRISSRDIEGLSKMGFVAIKDR